MVSLRLPIRKSQTSFKSIESKTSHCKPKINELAAKALGPGSVKEHDILRPHIPVGDAVDPSIIPLNPIQFRAVRTLKQSINSFNKRCFFSWVAEDLLEGLCDQTAP